MNLPAVTQDLADDAAWDADVLAVGVAAPDRPSHAGTGAGRGAGRGAGTGADESSGEGAEAGAVAPDRLATVAAARYGVDLAAVLATEKVTGRAGEVVRVPVVAPDGLPARFLLVGSGARRPADLRRAGAALARATRGRRVLATSLAAGLPRDGESVRALLEGLILGGYTPPSSGHKDRSESLPAQVVRLVGTGRAAPQPPAVARGLLVAGATVRARDLAATPSNVKNPRWLAAQAEQAALDAGLAVRVWDEQALVADGFGGILAVGAGSASPPRLVRVDYPGTGATRDAARGTARVTARVNRGVEGAQRPVVLVGKGITFDTGGLSIKPRESMVAMKTDMTGAAVVLSVLLACRELGVRRPVVGLLPMAENAVGGSSYRPSDVVHHYGGRTVEVANTDAEGRMVLADALAYADAVLDPQVVVDVATLTGAASLGLGKRHAALFATDDRLAGQLEAAATASGERVWRLPLVEDYTPALDSDVADLRHVARDTKIGGGAITAALFLRAFAGDRPWAHLDIAGPARADRDEHEVTKGATGFGARLLLRWLESLA